MSSLTFLVLGAFIVAAMAAVFFGILNKSKTFVDTDYGSLFEFETLSEREKIERFISNDEFYQMYQPIVDSYTEKIVGCEALTRLRSDDKTVVMPDDFLGAVRTEKMYDKFDMFVFKKCCKWIKQHADKDIFLTCNFSRWTLANENLVKDITSIIKRESVSPEKIAIEITEDVVQSNEDKMIKNIEALKNKGFKIYLDDFGKAYTSLEDLTNFSPDVIKIDKNMLHTAHEKNGKIVFDNVVRLAKEINAAVLCEGIETEEQLKLAREAGCDLLQGYYFYKPVKTEVLDELLQN